MIFIEVKNLSYTYGKGTAFEKTAVNNVSVNIEKGDIIGVSVLNKNQVDVASTLGDKHSDEVDKFEGLDYEVKDTAILINNASRKMVCKVIDVLHLEGIEVDNLLYLNIVSTEENEDNFLHYSDL